jgi:hypothetical protein
MHVRWYSVLLVLLALLVAAGCSTLGTQEAEVTAAAGTGDAPPLEMAISAQPRMYSPLMSSTPGIRLTAWNASGVLPPDATFLWEASYGQFLTWDPPASQVVELGPEARRESQEIYWSFLQEPEGEDRRDVVITLTVTDGKAGSPLARSEIRIAWKEGLTVEVRPPR